MAEDLKETVSATESWKRLAFMLLFCVAFNVAVAVVIVMVVAQFLLKLFTAEVNPRLQEAGGEFGAYLRQIVEFLTYRSEVMPYPFAAWPRAGETAPSVTPPPKPARPRRRAPPPSPPPANDGTT